MKKIFFFAFVTRKLLKFIESLSHVNFCQTKFFFLRIQVLAITRCIETYDIYHRDVSEMYELCSNKRSEILLVVWNVCLWNTERSASKMSLLKLSFELSNNTKTHCCFSDQRIKIRWCPRIRFLNKISCVSLYFKVRTIFNAYKIYQKRYFNLKV